MTQSSKKKNRNTQPEDKAVNETEQTTSTPNTASELDTVREILFGAQVKQHHEKQSELEQLIKDSIAQLSAESDKRFKQIEAKIDDLNESLQAEAKLRDQSDDNLHQDLQSLLATVEKLDTTTTDASADLQDQLVNQAEQIYKQLDKVHTEMSEALQREFSKLNRDKADRSSLAVLLNGIASQLSDSENRNEQPEN